MASLERNVGTEDTQSQWVGDATIKGKSQTTRLVLLTICLAGLQFTWSVEQSYGTPYLLSLGLSKAQMSLVWLAGPLSGLITQPLVGAMSDRSRMRLGRRRPFMIAGSVVVGLNLFIIGWTREIGSLFISVDSDQYQTLVISIAVVSVYLLDFAINAVQAACRAIIVDTLPAQKQEIGNAWASRMVAGGHLIGYTMGFLNLTKYLFFLGDTQLKVICLLSTMGLFITVGITCYGVSERVLLKRGVQHGRPNSALFVVASIWHTVKHLPPRIRTIFAIQFFAWLGWFNMLFYSSTWVGEVYARHQNGLPSSEDEGDSDITDTVGHIARIGSMALVVFSCITLVSSVILPPFVRKPDDERKPQHDENNSTSRLAQIWQQSRIPMVFNFLVEKAQPVRPPLTIAWVIGHGIFAFAMFCSPFVRNVSGATFVVGLCGLPWAITCWAPFALLGDEIAKMGRTEEGYEMVEANLERRSPPPSYDEIEKEGFLTEDGIPESSNARRRDSLESELSSAHSDDLEVFNDDPTRPSEERVLRLAQRNSDLQSRPLSVRLHEPAPTNDVAGEMLGIMNVFVTLPQFIMTFVSSVIFAILEPGKSKELTEGKVEARGGVSAIAVVMVIGGLGSIVAAWLTMKLRRLR